MLPVRFAYIANQVNREIKRYDDVLLDYDTITRYYTRVNKKQPRTLQMIFARPVRGNIPWMDIENLFLALGAEIYEGSGSRVRIYLNGLVAIFHRPHPEKETDKGAVVRVRTFLQDAGVKL